MGIRDMVQFWKVVNEVIRKAHILLLVLDARSVEQTRNLEIERKIQQLGKPLIYVITKCDLVEKDFVEKYKEELNPAVFVSSTEFHGMNLLKERIMIEAKRTKIKEGPIYVGVLGYPNVGKSSIINVLAKRNVVSVSVLSGHTKAIKRITAFSNIVLLDTPGVIPYREKDDIKHALTGTIDFTKAKDPELVVTELMKTHPGSIERFYGVDVKDDFEYTINSIAIKKNILKKGAVPDIQRMARAILKDWQKGDIK